MPGYHYAVHADASSRAWFRSLLEWAGVSQPFEMEGGRDGSAVFVRSWSDPTEDRWFLWIVNMTPATREVRVRLDGANWEHGGLRVHRGGTLEVEGPDRLLARVPGRDAALIGW